MVVVVMVTLELFGSLNYCFIVGFCRFGHRAGHRDGHRWVGLGCECNRWMKYRGLLGEVWR